jgi:hypothetical protein
MCASEVPVSRLGIDAEGCEAANGAIEASSKLEECSDDRWYLLMMSSWVTAGSPSAPVDHALFRRAILIKELPYIVKQ